MTTTSSKRHPLQIPLISHQVVLVLTLLLLALGTTVVSGFSTVRPHTASNRVSRKSLAKYPRQQPSASASASARLFLASDDSNTESDTESSSEPSTATAAAATTTATTSNSNAVLDEANDALYNVGWAPSLREEGELTSDDPFVKEIDAGIQRDFGVPLDELLNPAKVVNLERDLYNLRLELAQATGVTLDSTDVKSNADLTTERCDGGGGGEDAAAIRAKIDKKEKDLIIERRSVFRGWLKNVFLVQAILSFGLSWVMATQPEVLFGGFGWYNMYNMDISIKVLGYWWWWLFVVPSLRSRRPKGAEKKALDIAFLATPLISLVAPAATRDTGIIWTANLVVVVACYAFAFATGDDDSGDDDDSNTPEWLKFVYKSLDFGTGRERGARN